MDTYQEYADALRPKGNGVKKPSLEPKDLGPERGPLKNEKKLKDAEKKISIIEWVKLALLLIAIALLIYVLYLAHHQNPTKVLEVHLQRVESLIKDARLSTAQALAPEIKINQELPPDPVNIRPQVIEKVIEKPIIVEKIVYRDRVVSESEYKKIYDNLVKTLDRFLQKPIQKGEKRVIDFPCPVPQSSPTLQRVDQLK